MVASLGAPRTAGGGGGVYCSPVSQPIILSSFQFSDMPTFGGGADLSDILISALLDLGYFTNKTITNTLLLEETL